MNRCGSKCGCLATHFDSLTARINTCLHIYRLTVANTRTLAASTLAPSVRCLRKLKFGRVTFWSASLSPVNVLVGHLIQAAELT